MTLALDHIKYCWEQTPLSASEIGTKFGLTRNQVIHYSWQYRWISYTKGKGKTRRKYRLFEERLAALEDRFNEMTK